MIDEPAQTQLGLTNDYELVHRTLDRILARSARGLTHMAAGVDQATLELAGLHGALSEPDPTNQKVAVFLTDGLPSLPFAMDTLANTSAALSAAKRAAAAGVRIFTFGVGPLALEFPLARRRDRADHGRNLHTGPRPRAPLGHLRRRSTSSEIESLEVRNTTLGDAAQTVDVGADGSFGAFVPLRTGRNTIEVTARASGGRVRTEHITLHFAPDAPAVETPPGLLPIQNKLLELRLTELRRERIDAEQRRDEATRKQLEIEIERERRHRCRARQRAAQGTRAEGREGRRKRIQPRSLVPVATPLSARDSRRPRRNTLQHIDPTLDGAAVVAFGAHALAPERGALVLVEPRQPRRRRGELHHVADDEALGRGIQNRARIRAEVVEVPAQARRAERVQRRDDRSQRRGRAPGSQRSVDEETLRAHCTWSRYSESP